VPSLGRGSGRCSWLHLDPLLCCGTCASPQHAPLSLSLSLSLSSLSVGAPLRYAVFRSVAVGVKLLAAMAWSDPRAANFVCLLLSLFFGAFCGQLLLFHSTLLATNRVAAPLFIKPNTCCCAFVFVFTVTFTVGGGAFVHHGSAHRLPPCPTPQPLVSHLSPAALLSAARCVLSTCPWARWIPRTSHADDAGGPRPGPAEAARGGL